jgi:hypothetical protein
VLAGAVPSDAIFTRKTLFKVISEADNEDLFTL